MIATGSAVAVLALLLTAVTVFGGRDAASAAPLLPRPLLTATGGDREAAVGVLREAAAHQRSARVEGTGPVHYTLRQTYGLDVTVAQRKATTTAATYLVSQWRRPDGSQRIDQFRQQVDRVGRDVGAPEPAPAPRRPTLEVPAADGDDTAALPTDPAQLRTILEAGIRVQGRVPTGTDTARLVLDRLDEGGTSPAQNAALFEILSEIPGLFDAGPVTDRAGRAARAVGVQVSGPESLAKATGYLLLSEEGTPLTIETVYLTPPPGLHLPAEPTVATYTQCDVDRQVTAAGKTR